MSPAENYNSYLSGMGGIQLAFRYLRYLITSNTKYDVHSPFVFNFINEVLKDARHFYAFDEIEFLRDRLLNDVRIIHVEDKGAGSRTMKDSGRQVKQIAATSLTNTKFGELLFRIANYFQPAHMLELGTSLGISGLYLAKGNPSGRLLTIEGSPEVAKVAEEIFKMAGRGNIKLVTDEFSHALKNQLVPKSDMFELIYIDGNHREEPTLHYFEYLLRHHSNEDTIFIFDDIHWSKGMESAWEHIKEHKEVTLTIDLFFKGIVFLRKDFHQQQHMVIKF